MNVEDVTVSFSSSGVVGLPSNPIILNLNYMPGDADGSGRIDINDVTLAIQATFGTIPTNCNAAACDMDGNGRIDINDVTLIINLTFQ